MNLILVKKPLQTIALYIDMFLIKLKLTMQVSSKLNFPSSGFISIP